MDKIINSIYYILLYVLAGVGFVHILLFINEQNNRYVTHSVFNNNTIFSVKKDNNKTAEVRKATVVWHVLDSLDEVNKFCHSITNIDKSKRIGGCASFNLKTKYCEIFAVQPTGVNGTFHSYLGHELRHCMEGSFHEN